MGDACIVDSPRCVSGVGVYGGGESDAPVAVGDSLVTEETIDADTPEGLDVVLGGSWDYYACTILILAEAVQMIREDRIPQLH
jgi:hypothetical protein